MKNQLIIAHRGESFIAPENTVEAVKLAYEKGVSAVEIDVRLTKDKQIVVIHDAHTWRITKKLKWIRRTSLSDLKKLDFGNYKGEEYKGEKIPSLNEILDLVTVGKKLIIEIKSSKEIIPFLKDVLNRYSFKADQIEIISFSLKTLVKVKELIPQHTVLWIHSLDYYLIRRIFRPSLETIIRKAKKNGIDGLDIWAGKILNSKAINEIKDAKLKLYTWTINSPKKAKWLFELGVDGITTDRANWIENQLKELKC